MDIFAGIARAVDAGVGLKKVHYRLGAIAKVLIGAISARTRSA